MQLDFTFPSHTCLATWSGYRGGNDKSDEHHPNPLGTKYTWGASTLTSGASWESGGDTRLLREDKVGDA